MGYGIWFTGDADGVGNLTDSPTHLASFQPRISVTDQIAVRVKAVIADLLVGHQTLVEPLPALGLQLDDLSSAR